MIEVKIRINRGDGSRPGVQWVWPGDTVKFTHTAEIKLADGSKITAGPPRVFKVDILGARLAEIEDSEYVPPLNTTPALTVAFQSPAVTLWQRLTARLTKGRKT